MSTNQQKLQSSMSSELNPRDYSGPAPVEATLCHGCAGWYVEWFQEAPDAQLGYRTAHWYGTREACVARMAQPSPALLPARGDGAGPYDAATAAGMYD